MASLIYNIIMFAIQAASGTQGPPPPARGDDPEGPHLPLDDNIWILLVVGILFGVYILYRRNRAINKAA